MPTVGFLHDAGSYGTGLELEPESALLSIDFAPCLFAVTIFMWNALGFIRFGSDPGLAVSVGAEQFLDSGVI